MKQLDAACDRWNVFTDRADEPYIIKAYDAVEWGNYWQDYMATPIQVVYRHIFRTYGGPRMKAFPFDWVVKVDDDSFVRPSTFRKLFKHHDPDKSILLGGGGEV